MKKTNFIIARKLYGTEGGRAWRKRYGNKFAWWLCEHASVEIENKEGITGLIERLRGDISYLFVFAESGFGHMFWYTFWGGSR